MKKDPNSSPQKYVRLKYAGAVLAARHFPLENLRKFLDRKGPLVLYW